MPSRIAAVLFDFDGVIVHSEPIHCRSYVETSAEMGVPIAEADYYRELIGYDDRGAIARVYELHDRPLDEATVEQFIRMKTRRVIDLLRSGEITPLPGVARFVAALNGQATLAICSGALRNEINVMLDGIGLREAFAVITSAEDVAIGKPDPSGYILTARRVSEKIGRPIEHDQCLVIEDAPNVALRARGVGFEVLGVETTYPASRWPREIATVPSLEPVDVLARFPQLPLELDR